MALTVAEQRAAYPIAAFNFRVTVGSLAMGFSEVSGLARSYETLTYRHGLSCWEGEAITKFRIDKYVQLTLRKGLIPGAGAREVYGWLDDVDKRPLQVSLCDVHPDDPAQPPLARVTWHVRKALIVKLEAPSLQAQGNDVVIETLTLMASGISIEQH
jgi:phage tail-like protein